ncbi:hypothetical protein TNCV_139591 [Trichonephila clavipes]|uniref:Uncharacterized protein n=1 Tax=Trichonephila clavipes TaxID=2585209 RepID=A0A8X6RMB2_TRICX|nr:hypothetical protein TNCV_139591 [Trichonephila clavipes]
MAFNGTDGLAASIRNHSSSTVLTSMVMSPSLGKHGADVFYWREIRFVVDHTIQHAPVCDAASRVAASMVSQLRVNPAANVIEMFV